MSDLVISRSMNPPSSHLTSGSDITSDDMLIELFLRAKSQRTGSEHTKRAYEKDIGDFRQVMWKPIRTVTYRDLIEWSGTLTGSNATRSRRISAIKSLFAFAMQVGFLQLNPASVLDRPAVPVTSTERYLTKNELNRLLKAAKGMEDSHPHLYTALVLMSTTALRISEAVGIKWADAFEDVHGRIGIRIMGKGAKRRTVKVLPHVWSLIKAYRDRHERSADLDPQDESPLFIGYREQALTPAAIQHAIEKAAERAGIKKKVSPHWLRHTAITLALVGGARVEQAQAMAGHSDLRTTTRYAHTAQELQNTAADYIDIDVQ